MNRPLAAGNVPARQRVRAADLPARPGRTVTVAGRVHRRRLLKSVAFLVVRDATGLVQVVVTDPVVRAAVDRLTEETVVEVTGERWPSPPPGRGGGDQAHGLAPSL